MLRTFALGVAAAASFLTAPVANAAFISTATIEGVAAYDTNGVNLPQMLGALGIPLATPATPISLGLLGPTGYNFGLALSLTDFDIDLPQVNRVVDWNIAIDFGFEATYREAGVPGPQTFNFNFADDADIGTFSINQAANLIAGVTFSDLDDLETNFLNLVSLIPPVIPIDGPAPGFNPIGVTFLTDQILPDPSLIILLQRDPLDFLGLDFLGIQRGRATISADLTLTAVPEPASIALLGLGLAGLGIASRRRQA